VIRGHGRPADRSPRFPEPGQSGWDPLRQGKGRYSGAMPTRKGVGGSRLAFYTSHAEMVAAIVAEMHPAVAVYGRGDVSDDAARLRTITGPDGPRFPIAYVHDGSAHTYLPDFVGAGDRGDKRHASSRFVFEAGPLRTKATPRELAKLEAARSLVEPTGGTIIVVCPGLVPERWVRNALSLHVRRWDALCPTALLDEIERGWLTSARSIREISVLLAAEHPDADVEAAAYRVAGDLLAAGRLDVALDRIVFTLDTRVRARPVGSPPAVPPGLISDLGDLVRLADAAGGPTDDRDPIEDLDAEDRVIDLDAISDPRTRDLVVRRRAAIRAHALEGVSVAAAARRHGLSPRRLQQLVDAQRTTGEASLVPYATYQRAKSCLPVAMQDLVVRLYAGTERPTIRAIVEDARVHELARRLEMTRTPSAGQVRRVLDDRQAGDHDIRKRRAGKRLVPLGVRGRAATTEGRPAFACELDEATMDVKVVALAGSSVTIRLHLGAIVCVATRSVLSFVVAPKALDQWDYRRLLLRAVQPPPMASEPSPWPASAIPTILRADQGKINETRLAFQAAADLGVVLEFAPVRDGHAKAFIESFFGSLKDTFEHRLAISTKRSPDALGLHDPDAPAVRGEVDPEHFERILSRHLVEVYGQRWHGGLRERPCAVWEEASSVFGVRRWHGSALELRMLLKRPEGTRHVEPSHGISYLGRWYGGNWLVRHVGRWVSIKVDDDDLRSIDVYTTKGQFLGQAKHKPYVDFGRPVSRWEADLAKTMGRVIRAEAATRTLQASHEIVGELYGTDQRRLAKDKARRRLHRDRATETSTFEADMASLLEPAASEDGVPRRTIGEPLADDLAEFDALPFPPDSGDEGSDDDAG